MQNSRACSIGFVGFGGQQELNAKITEKIGLIAAGWFEAASGHEEKNHGAMDFVASPKVYRGLVLGRMEGALGIELHIAFEFWSEIVAEDEAGDPAIRSFVDKLITDFVIHIDGAKLLGEFKG
jgi:hypothetical protein